MIAVILITLSSLAVTYKNLNEYITSIPQSVHLVVIKLLVLCIFLLILHEFQVEKLQSLPFYSKGMNIDAENLLGKETDENTDIEGH